MIAVGSDHAGYNLKAKIKEHLTKLGMEFKDFGCDEGERCDYPDIAFLVAEAVAAGECVKGILCCGTGIGVSIAANKVRGIRAAVATESTSAGLAKEHNLANILCLGGRIVGEALALEIVDSWLFSEFMSDRHLVRIDKISQYEEGRDAK